MHVQILHADPLCLLCLSGIVVGNVWNISVRYAKSASSFGRNLNLTAEVKEGKFTCLFFQPVTLLVVHLWRPAWLCDSDMCSICRMYKHSGAQSEILALKFHCCDPGKSANSLIWPKELLGSRDFTRQLWFAHLALTGWFPLHWWANITQVVLFSIRHLSFCNHLNTGICPNKLQMLYSSKQKLF